ncbi:MAG: catalytic domain of component of various dehydrogenase complexe [Frankiales bacterium]|nr:catalytic domain of component of various dehydrogenase complexe [Frankiales bacterium]
MAELKDFKLPDVGEGLTEADILRWDVAVGDSVVVNQVLVEVETAKAAVELPSPFAGVVTQLHYPEGATVEVGRPIISIRVGAGELPAQPDQPVQPDVRPVGGPTSSGPDASPAGGSAAGRPGSAEELIPALPADGSADQPAGDATSPKREAVLVGYGVAGERGRRRRRTTSELAPSANDAFGVHPPATALSAAPRQVAAKQAEGPAAFENPLTFENPASIDNPASFENLDVLAKPPVRKLAKTLGVDLFRVAPTGPNGTISRNDIQEAAQRQPDARTDGRPGRAPTGGETRVPIKGVRKHTAAAMVASAFTAPHVTEFVTVDVTAMMELRDRVSARREFRDLKVSPLLFVARALLWAAGRTPIINSHWDADSGDIVIKHYVNLGIAAATDRGLIVPNIKSAQSMTLLELATAIGALTDTARAGRTSPADMAGGTITITNVGVFGVDTGTPILNPGEAAIVAMGAIRRQPWVVGEGADERIEPRWVTQLAVSFDHRSVDGQQGSQFLADLAALLHDPGLAQL